MPLDKRHHIFAVGVTHPHGPAPTTTPLSICYFTCTFKKIDFHPPAQSLSRAPDTPRRNKCLAPKNGMKRNFPMLQGKMSSYRKVENGAINSNRLLAGSATGNRWMRIAMPIISRKLGNQIHTNIHFFSTDMIIPKNTLPTKHPFFNEKPWTTAPSSTSAQYLLILYRKEYL